MEGQVTVRTRKLMRNPLLSRRQMVVDVIHPGRKPVSKKELREHIAKLHKVDVNTVIVYGFQTAFGGGRSTGFGLIYDSVEELKKYEPRYRCVSLGAVHSRAAVRHPAVQRFVIFAPNKQPRFSSC